jgi:hypothetical protein
VVKPNVGHLSFRLEPVTMSKIEQLVKTTQTQSCGDAIPTWMLERLIIFNILVYTTNGPDLETALVHSPSYICHISRTNRYPLGIFCLINHQLTVRTAQIVAFMYTLDTEKLQCKSVFNTTSRPYMNNAPVSLLPR